MEELVDYETAEKVFNSLDYNNQRNFLWSLSGLANRAQDKVQVELYLKKHQGLSPLINAVDSFRAKRMAVRLTDIGRQTKLQKLLAAA